jgi:hypothetical protein
MELAEEIICSCGDFITTLLIGDIQSLTLTGHLVGKPRAKASEMKDRSDGVSKEQTG